MDRRCRPISPPGSPARQSIRSGCAAPRRRPGPAPTLLVVEGVGGFLVPLRPGYLVRDFAVDLELPVVIAATPALGTINHTLLTIESVRAAGLEPAMVVLTPWPAEPGELERSNLETIAELGSVPVETLPWLDLSEPRAWPALAMQGSQPAST